MKALLKNSRLWCALVVLGAVLGASAYTALFEYIQYASAKQALIAEQNTLGSGGLMRYGIVISIDQTNQTITVSLPDQFYADQKRITRTYAIKQNAPITRQTLIGDGTTYTALSESQTISLSDIQTGENVAIYAPPSAGGNFVAWSITAGDPL